MITITWDNAAQKAAGMRALSVRVGTTHLSKWGDDVGEKGEQTVRDVIMAGGMNPTKKGGPRYKSGDMHDSAESRVFTSGGQALVRAGFGIDTNTPFYTKFQEGGTRPNNRPMGQGGNGSGITAMAAIPKASLEMGTEMDNAGMKMLSRIRADWNTI